MSFPLLLVLLLRVKKKRNAEKTEMCFCWSSHLKKDFDLLLSSEKETMMMTTTKKKKKKGLLDHDEEKKKKVDGEKE